MPESERDKTEWDGAVSYLTNVSIVADGQVIKEVVQEITTISPYSGKVLEVREIRTPK